VDTAVHPGRESPVTPHGGGHGRRRSNSSPESLRHTDRTGQATLESEGVDIPSTDGENRASNPVGAGDPVKLSGPVTEGE